MAFFFFDGKLTYLKLKITYIKFYSIFFAGIYLKVRLNFFAGTKKSHPQIFKLYPSLIRFFYSGLLRLYGFQFILDVIFEWNLIFFKLYQVEFVLSWVPSFYLFEADIIFRYYNLVRVNQKLKNFLQNKSKTWNWIPKLIKYTKWA